MIVLLRSAVVVAIPALLAVLTLAGCSRSEESAENIGPRLHRECVSIVGAAIAVAPREVQTSQRQGLIFRCILQRGKAMNGGEQ